ncbi:hypothetical protein B0J17DRAFT_571777, partial [Rhizoctonia solani]
ASASGDIFIFGGMVGGQFKNDTWAIRISEHSDQELTPEENDTHIKVSASLVEVTGEVPIPRFGHGSALAFRLLIVWGGLSHEWRATCI